MPAAVQGRHRGTHSDATACAPPPSQPHQLPTSPHTFMTSSTELLVSIRAFIAAMLLATASRTALLRVVSSVDGMEAAASVLASCTSCVMSAPEFRSAREGVRVSLGAAQIGQALVQRKSGRGNVHSCCTSPP